MKEFDRKVLLGAAALLVVGNGILLREVLLDDAARIERSVREIWTVRHRSDWADAKLAIYTDYMKSDSTVYVVDESDEFIRRLRKRSMMKVVRGKSEVDGWKLSIAGLKITGDSAVAGLAAIGGSVELYGVKLRKSGGTWAIVEWRLDGVGCFVAKAVETICDGDLSFTLKR